MDVGCEFASHAGGDSGCDLGYHFGYCFGCHAVLLYHTLLGSFMIQYAKAIGKKQNVSYCFVIVSTN